MKPTMQFICSLSLLCWMFCTDSKEMNGMFSVDSSFRLDLAENSVDDMYSTCNENMEELIKNKYFTKEMKNSMFAKVWRRAEKCAERNMKSRAKEDKALTKSHMQAICAYTAGGKYDFYKTFNEAVRTNKTVYGSSRFPFHSLHFWLTSAIEIMGQKQKCQKTYRRSTLQFEGGVGDMMRFGVFASTSKLPTLEHFGRKTCFEIVTCLGADLKRYPVMQDKEQEVLIPPYEVFEIAAIGQRTENLRDCESVFVLQRAGVLSRLNCLSGKPTKKHGFAPVQ